nr:PHP domain-containing protein [Burkholderia stabilis]
MSGSRSRPATKKQRAVTPSAGCDVWITNPDDRDKPSRLLLLVKDKVGYLNLCELLSKAWLTNQYRGRAELDASWLDGELAQGLLALSGAQQGDIGLALAAGNEEAARRHAERRLRRLDHQSGRSRQAVAAAAAGEGQGRLPESLRAAVEGMAHEPVSRPRGTRRELARRRARAGAARAVGRAAGRYRARARGRQRRSSAPSRRAPAATSGSPIRTIATSRRGCCCW